MHGYWPCLLKSDSSLACFVGLTPTADSLQKQNKRTLSHCIYIICILPQRRVVVKRESFRCEKLLTRSFGRYIVQKAVF